MKLTVKYKSGERRIVNLHPEFFSVSEIPLSKKAMDFAYEYGYEPYYVAVIRGGDIMYEATIRKNVPVNYPPSKKIDERKVKSILRKEHKNGKFNTKWYIAFN